ncbi:hypothetical protein CVS40_3245 [Lucilia cuprina]|nr:hypothetical protein CVS40_3245 [Lucilia cuprina]
MFRRYFSTLFLIMMLIFELQTIECTVKDIPANCVILRHDGRCVNNYRKQIGNVNGRFTNQNVKPKPYQKMVSESKRTENTNELPWYKQWFG